MICHCLLYISALNQIVIKEEKKPEVKNIPIQAITQNVWTSINFVYFCRLDS